VIRNPASRDRDPAGAAVLNGRVQIERLDPPELDLETAEEVTGVFNAAHEADGIGLPPRSGPSMLKYLQLQSDGTAVDGLWTARVGGSVVGGVIVQLPRSENTDSALLRGAVLPEARRQGIGRALVEEALGLARDAGRHKVYSGAFDGSPGGASLTSMGFASLGTADAVRRIELGIDSATRWQRVYDDASARAGAYELAHLVGPTPSTMLQDLVELHEAINDAPLDDPDLEGDHWSTDRVVAYDRAMAGRSQTVYRVLARHRASGDWAGMSMLCVDEFSPSVAFQEDTSVVRKHRGHRLGLLMKADMLRWLAEERPEVGATITWNATSNHHMIAVNEMLGATVVARHTNYRKDLERR
jgi:GNAT superfamily N-acetyltransferase